MHRWVISFLAVVVAAATIVSYSPIDTRSKELFYGVANGCMAGCFALLTPRRNEDG